MSNGVNNVAYFSGCEAIVLSLSLPVFLSPSAAVTFMARTLNVNVEWQMGRDLKFETGKGSDEKRLWVFK